MPNTKAAMKALRQDKKKKLVHLAIKIDVKKLIKDARKAIKAKAENASELVKKTTKAVDKAVQKGVFKKNNGSRKKSRLMNSLNAALEVAKK